jgi:hypothetical protein
MANPLFQTCYNLCRLHMSRQEEAAQASIILYPKCVMLRVPNSPLKQFAMPLLCNLAAADKSCGILTFLKQG